MQLSNGKVSEGSGYTAKPRVKVKRSSKYDAYSDLDQVSDEDELLAYYNLTVDQRKQGSWLNEGWDG